MSILACVLAAVAAICIYACVAHVFAARHPWFRGVHLTFGALALMAAVHATAHIAVYSAEDVADYVLAERYANLSGAFAMALVPWLVQGYFATGSRWVAIAMSVFYALSGALYEIAAIGSPSRPEPLLERISLPWGEVATIHRLPVVPLAAWIFWAVSLLLLGYIAALCASQRHLRGSVQAIAMTGSICALMLALAGNMLILAGQLDCIFLGEFGFLALVLTMMRLLSGEESYRAMIGQASVGIFVLSAAGRFLDANRVGCTMLARSRAELRKLQLQEILVAGAGATHDSRSIQAMRRGDGTTVLADISRQRLSDGRTLCIALDVTEAVRIETALRLLAESGPAEDTAAFIDSCVTTLARAFGARHAAVSVLDANGSVRILGQRPARAGPDESYALAGSPCAQLSAERRSMYVTRLGEQFPAHAPFAGCTSGGYLGAAILSSTGAVTGVVEVWDETPFVAGPGSQQILETFAHRVGAELERAAADRGLRELTATLEARVAERTSELARANEELEAFSYSVSHDLRGPVRAVDAHAAMLLEEAGPVLDSGARRHVERIAQAARRMRDLIAGLLQLAQLSHQPRTLQTVDLSQVATHTMELLQERDRQGRTVEFVCAPDMRVSTDPTAIGVVLTNLIENAWKYSSQVPRARIEFGVQQLQTQRVYFVRDNGAGFDMQHARRLFKPFQRLHAQDEYPGSGIGLATVERLIRRLGGRVWAESAPGQGASFYFTLDSAG